MISTRSRNTLQLAKQSKSGGARGSSTERANVGCRGPAPGRGRRGSGPGRLPAAAGVGRRGTPAETRGRARGSPVQPRAGPPSCHAAGPPPPPGRTGRARVSGIFQRRQPTRGVGARPPPPPPIPIPSAAGGGGTAREAEVSPFCSAGRRLALGGRVSAFGPAPAGSGGGPAAALGTPAGRGCGWGRGGGAAGPAPAG